MASSSCNLGSRLFGFLKVSAWRFPGNPTVSVCLLLQAMLLLLIRNNNAPPCPVWIRDSREPDRTEVEGRVCMAQLAPGVGALVLPFGLGLWSQNVNCSPFWSKTGRDSWPCHHLRLDYGKSMKPELAAKTDLKGPFRFFLTCGMKHE